ncbi:Uncharacterized protein BP5553_01741 [Venustampulla echinocandica]|uniref:Spherulation-specific family 4 n=1 Tax=Venustampulla echinocandica TaxID=2656787 RepID=A0A370U1V6_9HELO|nr:Uncharacterized protein BP5553_01741 [Venustampulla echinocandica]RDL41762.1 Uncharacterized protein BP5553_01741 [Venustampulla echinocandica]
MATTPAAAKDRNVLSPGSVKTVTMVNPYIFLPLYLYPINSSWEGVIQSAVQYPDVNFQIVVAPNLVNVIPDQNYIENLQALNNLTNVRTLGYVPTNWATRDMATVEQEIDCYAAWANYTEANIRVSGIFFDEAPSAANSDNLSYMGNVTSYARTALGPGTDHMTFNPGVFVDPAWYKIADEIIIFENTWAAFNWSKLNELSWDLMNQSVFLVYNFTGSTKDQKDLVRNLTDSNVGGSFITTQDGYTSLSTLWPQFVESMNDVTSSDFTGRDDDGDDCDDDDDDDDEDDDGDDDDDNGDDGDDDDGDDDEDQED